MSDQDTNAQDLNAQAPAGKRDSIFHRLYVGTGAFDIVGKRKRWYAFFAVLMLACLASILLRGFNLGIDFEGGTQIQMPANLQQGMVTEQQVQDVFTDVVGSPADEVQMVGTGPSTTVQIRTETIPNSTVSNVKEALYEQLRPLGPNGQPSATTISDSNVSPSWGGEISRQALIALGVFLVLVTVFLALYFERWMAVSAIVALLHDVLVTAGVYSMVGFEVTPASVIGLLTILGFSLYDTVVVFDKVKENTRGILGLTRRTYAEAANLALNQTLARSINTSVIALLPVVGLMVIGVGLLGVGTLGDLALVQMVGMIAGAVSSILLATPLLVDLKMTSPAFQQQAERVRTRRASQARKAASAEQGDEVESTDDESLDAELRKEKASVAAASVPARAQASRSASGGGRSAKSGKGGRPSGKASRPTGKKRR